MSSGPKLSVSLTSPFARKCRVALTALDLSSEISISTIDPWKDTYLRAINPLSKVPTLLLDDAKTSLYDSRVIVEYLDSLAPMPRLVPPSGEPHWRCLRLQALCDGACSTAGRFYAAESNPSSLDIGAKSKERLRTAVYSTLDQLEQREDLNSKDWNIGDVCAAILPSYWSFRVPEEEWRDGRPRLAKFVGEMEKCKAFRENQYICEEF